MVASPLTLMSIFLEQAQVVKCPALQPVTTQTNSPRPKPSPPSLSIRFHSRDFRLHSWGCRPPVSAGGAIAMQPLGPPRSQEMAVASFGQPPPPPWASERGIPLLGVSLRSQSGGNSSEGMAVTSAAIRLCPHGTRPASAALGPLHSTCLPCSGLTQTPV